MRPDSQPSFREYLPEDAPAIRRLALPEIERSVYRSGPRSAVESLIGGTDADARSLVAVRDGVVIGVVLHGMIAGSVGAGRVQLIVTDPAQRRTGIARQLVEAAVRGLRDAGARFAAVELPDDPALAPGASLLRRCAFHLEARVPDFHQDGIDLLIFRRDLSTS